MCLFTKKYGCLFTKKYDYFFSVAGEDIKKKERKGEG
jgi:hypothetical protein